MKKRIIGLGLSILIAGSLTGCQNSPEELSINHLCVKGSVSKQTHEIAEIGNYMGMNLVKVVHNDGSICDSDIHQMWFKYNTKTGEIAPHPYNYDIDNYVVNGFCKK